ncbi:hypothetical protein C9374_000411 [Naegleria lovaniensis]|uniref:Saposin B-type domain-containing protein n=1 Tax=Naegleria lovaniensis TaxID=51637 RepID=A0AA88GWD5_NAELO|nr:uncharacterized protein C9374_000411 [Naegleria lovaniensis]KAG2388247.1 hypothetical protein C9374_000411 [Naegleria lovaniensis]
MIKLSTLALFSVLFSLYATMLVMGAGIIQSNPTTMADQLKHELKARLRTSPALFNKLLKLTIKEQQQQQASPATLSRLATAKNSYELCDLCINLLDQTINNLVNIILNVGVIGGCGDICKYLSNLGSLTVVACNLVCDYLGVNEFINMIENADLDAIYGCQLVSLCPIRDCKAPVCAQFFNTRVVPAIAPKGTTFNAVSQLRIYNQTGTGELYFEVDGPVTADIAGGELKGQGFAPGNYDIQVQIQAQDDEQNQVVWFPGKYEFFVAACEGECGSKHPHSRILAESRAFFNITQN